MVKPATRVTKARTTKNTSSRATKRKKTKITNSSMQSILRNTWSITWKLSLALAIALFFYFIYLNQLITPKFIQGETWHLPAQVYARPMSLYPDAKVNKERLIAELNILGYIRTKNPTKPGEYSVAESKVKLWRRSFFHPTGQQDALLAQVMFNNTGIASIVAVNSKKEVGLLHLEPLLLDRIITSNNEDRVFIKLENVPKFLISTLIQVEDRDFYTHHGVNPFAIARALVANLLAGHTVQGGSTLTQQLAKNLFLTRERSFIRKFKEACMALIIDFRYSKDQILEVYLNEVYMGQGNNREINGIGLASKFYFGRPLNELSIEQQALLVGVIKGPSFYNPWKNPERTLDRRNLVLKIAFDKENITAKEYQSAIKAGFELKGDNFQISRKIPAFIQLIKQELHSEYGDFLQQSGVKIYTTLDPVIQKNAELAVKHTMESLIKSKKDPKLQAAMIVTNKYTGDVEALISDKDPGYAGFNRSLEMRRPIGSLIKPFIYAKALSSPEYNLLTSLKDEPLKIKVGNKIWSPKNSEKQYRHQVPLITALKDSLNVPTVNLGMALGVSKITELLKNAGWSDEIEDLPSTLLGSINGSPYMVATAYQVFATDGQTQSLHSILYVLNENNIQIPSIKKREHKRVLSAEATYLTKYALTKVVASGTAKKLGAAFPGVTIAGKTGTTDSGRDTWFMGMDAANLAVIWVGHDDFSGTNLYGSSGAMLIYKDFLTKSPPFSLTLPMPKNVTIGYFSEDGKAVSKDCSNAVKAPALKASYANISPCEVQKSKKSDLPWWKKIFN